MGPGPARITDGAGDNRRYGAPAAGLRGRAGMFVLAAASGLALASGAVTGTPAAHAAATAAARPAAAAHARPEFEPCPCTDLRCREVCSQSMASGGPAFMIHQQTHLAARAMVTMTATAVNCPPPATPATASSDGQPSC
jgi:hypothetical protein